jgi:hypothetical protein
MVSIDYKILVDGANKKLTLSTEGQDWSFSKV